MRQFSLTFIMMLYNVSPSTAVFKKILEYLSTTQITETKIHYYNDTLQSKGGKKLNLLYLI